MNSRNRRKKGKRGKREKRNNLITEKPLSSHSHLSASRGEGREDR